MTISPLYFVSRIRHSLSILLLSTLFFLLFSPHSIAQNIAPSAQEAIQQYLRAIEKNDLVQVANFLQIPPEQIDNTPELKTKMNALLSATSQEIASKKGIQSITTVREEIQNDRANITVRISYNDQSTEDMDFSLSLIHQKWVFQ